MGTVDEFKNRIIREFPDRLNAVKSEIAKYYSEESIRSEYFWKVSPAEDLSEEDKKFAPPHEQFSWILPDPITALRVGRKKQVDSDRDTLSPLAKAYAMGLSIAADIEKSEHLDQNKLISFNLLLAEWEESIASADAHKSIENSLKAGRARGNSWNTAQADRMIAEGKTNRQIGNAVGTSAEMIRRYRNRKKQPT